MLGINCKKQLNYYKGGIILILFISEKFSGVNGPTNSSLDVLKALVHTGNSVTVLSQDKKIEIPYESKYSLDWVTVPNKFTFNTVIPQNIISFYNNFNNLYLKYSLKPYLSKLRSADLAIVNSFSDHFLWQSINSVIKCNSTIIVRCSPKAFNNKINQTKYINLEQIIDIMKLYTYLIFVSSRCREEWLSLEEFKDKKTFYIPNCCNEEKVRDLLLHDRKNIRKNLGISKDDFIAVCVASIQFRKGQDLLVNYSPFLLKLIPNLKIIFIGSAGRRPWSWGNKLIRTIKLNNFQEHLIAVGSKTNALDYIYAADVLILPSRSEGMPRVVLEAMALKTPVIASDVDGITELIENNKTGLLFSHNKPEQIVDLILRIAQSPHKRNNFSEKAYKIYWSKFSRKMKSKRYKEAIAKMINS